MTVRPDVARALEFAQNHNLPLAVRGGGHSRAGFGVCDGGVVIDLSGMQRVEVDPGKRVARAEAGSLTGPRAAPSVLRHSALRADRFLRKGLPFRWKKSKVARTKGT